MAKKLPSGILDAAASQLSGSLVCALQIFTTEVYSIVNNILLMPNYKS